MECGEPQLLGRDDHREKPGPALSCAQPGGGRRRCRGRQRGGRPTRHPDRQPRPSRPISPRRARAAAYPRRRQRRVGDGLVPTVGQRHGHSLGTQRRDGELESSLGRRGLAHGVGPRGPLIPRPAPRRRRSHHPPSRRRTARAGAGHQPARGEEPVEHRPSRGGRWERGGIAEFGSAFRYHRRGVGSGDVGQEREDHALLEPALNCSIQSTRSSAASSRSAL